MWAVEDDAANLQTYAEALRDFYAVSSDLKSCLSAKNPDLNDVRSKVLLLKRLSRQAYFRNKHVQNDVLESKKGVAEKHLQLQNLLYEVMHLQKEVKKCLDFRSGDEAIDLISLPDFLSAMPSDYDATALSAHQVQLDRLNFELSKRKELQTKHCERIAERKELADQIAKLESSLDGLGPKLQDVIEATLSVQKALGKDFLFENDQIQASKQLPDTLYTLYAQGWSFAKLEKRLKLQVLIEGDVKAVPAYLRSVSRNLISQSPSPEPRDPEDRERSQSQDVTSVAHGKGIIQAPQNMPDSAVGHEESETPAKRVKIDSKHGKRKESKNRDEDAPGPFPLSVLFKMEYEGVRLDIRFWHFAPASDNTRDEPHILCKAELELPNGKCKTVPVIGDGNLFLKNLFPVPSNAEELKLNRGMLHLLWVQQLCGLKAPENHTSKAEQLQSFSKFVELIFQGLKNRKSMVGEVVNLEENKLDLPPNIPFVLSRFDGLSPEQALSRLSKIGHADVDTLIDGQDCVWFFDVALERIGTDHLEKTDMFIIAVHTAYPRTAPKFWCTTAKKDMEFRLAIERAMNLECWEGGKDFSNGMSNGLSVAAQMLFDPATKHTPGKRCRVGPSRKYL